MYVLLMALFAIFHVAHTLEMSIAEEIPYSMHPKAKIDVLPEISWNVLHIDLVNRENLCTRQIAYCANSCGGPDEAPKNFCNATSMAWGCGCSKKKVSFTKHSWPVVQAECAGKAQECRSICTKDVKNLGNCVTACNNHYQCGTNKAPASFLETNDPSDKPFYNGSGSGKNIPNREIGLDEYGIADFTGRASSATIDLTHTLYFVMIIQVLHYLIWDY
ncbi:hypothetical protein EDC96DRAFT_601017 [Choanephora cucurbitarum]|nr:hypothetical protein EDC96DRAFT_601017 [Choanephora cucurbitarum]